MTPLRFTVIPAVPPNAFLRRPHSLPFPLDTGRCTVFDRGRHCLWQGARSVGLQPGDTVLAPAYHHGSEIQALLEAGLEVRFYDLAPDLSPDQKSLERIVDKRVRALHVTHFLGLPQDGARWREWCDRRDILLIEDVAQGWLGRIGERHLGSFGDVAIFCLYKQLGTPDGAALLTRGTVPGATPSEVGPGRAFKRAAAWVASRSSTSARLSPRVRDRPKSEAAEEDFAMGDPSRGPLGTTRYLLPRVYRATVAPDRRANYEFLLERLESLVPAPFDDLPEEACPFALPIETPVKDELYHRLQDRLILAQDLWRIPHPTLRGDFPVSTRLRTRLLALPVHQELRRSDLERIADAVREELEALV